MPSELETQKETSKKMLRTVHSWALLIILQSLGAILWLLLIPKEPGNAVFMGYSLRRLALVAPMALPILAGILTRVSAARSARWIKKLASPKRLSKTFMGLVFWGALLAAAVWSFVFLFFFLKFFPDLGAYYRLLPLSSSYFLLGLEAMLIAPVFFYPNKKSEKPKKKKSPPITFLLAFVILLGVFILIEATGLGKDPERFSIISLGAPILEGQIWYIAGLLALTIAAAYAWQSIPRGDRKAAPKRGDLMVMALLWLMAAALWMSLPLPSNNYFAPQVQPPNFEKYPFSDAEQYDLNALFVYYGSLDDYVISKPMYVSLLAILHAIGGLSYANIVLLQTLIVAIFPPVLYLIGRELHSRLGGVAIALFAIFREVSSIQATSIANTSNTKLLLSDMPAALLAAILALTLIRWFKFRKKKIGGYEFLIGGLIGIFALVRIQTILLIPAAIILVILRYWPKFKPMLTSALILLLAFSLVITPVLLRNHAITGVYWVDNPSSSAPLSRILTEGLESFEDEELLKGGDEVVNQNVRIYLDLLFNNFGFFVNFILDHFARNLISSFLVMPVRFGNQVAFLNFLTFDGYFWGEVYSLANLKNMLVIILNLLLIALGISKAYARNTEGLMLTVGFFLYYNLTSSIARLSGWRFILPVDWVVYAFYALGMLELILWLIRAVARWNIQKMAFWLTAYPESESLRARAFPWYAGFGALFLLTGVFIPMRERLLPSLLPDYTRAEVCEKIDAALSENGEPALEEDFMRFCLSEETRVLKGFAIYPRYFKSGQGFYDRSYDPWFGKQDYARLVFRLIGARNAKVYIKTAAEDAYMPNGATIYVAGREKNKFEAQFVLVEGAETELLISSALLMGEEALISGE